MPRWMAPYSPKKFVQSYSNLISKLFFSDIGDQKKAYQAPKKESTVNTKSLLTLGIFCASQLFLSPNSAHAFSLTPQGRVIVWTARGAAYLLTIPAASAASKSSQKGKGPYVESGKGKAKGRSDYSPQASPDGEASSGGSRDEFPSSRWGDSGRTWGYGNDSHGGGSSDGGRYFRSGELIKSGALASALAGALFLDANSKGEPLVQIVRLEDHLSAYLQDRQLLANSVNGEPGSSNPEDMGRLVELGEEFSKTHTIPEVELAEIATALTAHGVNTLLAGNEVVAILPVSSEATDQTIFALESEGQVVLAEYLKSLLLVSGN